MTMVPETDFSNLTGNYTWQSTQLTPLRVSVLLDPSFYLDHTSLVKINPARLLRPILLLFFSCSLHFSPISHPPSPSSWHQCSRKDALTDLQVILLLVIQEEKNFD